MSSAPATIQPGIYLVHKPIGPTSFSILKQFQESIAAKPGRRAPRLCHGGTLDPFASGLLLILVEPATRLFDYLHDIPKTYEATVRWGVETDNGDPHGKVIFTGDASALTATQLDEALAGFIGWQDQTPHVTSARRIDGERAYEKAHRGETFEMPAARVYLHEAAWLDHDLPHNSRLRIVSRGGYYVRALARDLGLKLGCGAHLSTLRRAAIGPWLDPGEAQAQVVTGRGVLSWLPSRTLTDQEVGDLRQDRIILAGRPTPPESPLPASFPATRPIVRGFHREKLCFLLAPEAGGLKPVVALGIGL